MAYWAAVESIDAVRPGDQSATGKRVLGGGVSDTPRTMKEKIIARMWPVDGVFPGQWVSMGDLNMICFRYGGRLHDLKREGWDFEKQHRDDGSWWYRLTAAPENFGMTSSCRDKAPVVVATRPSEPKKRRGKYHKTQITMEGIV